MIRIALDAHPQEVFFSVIAAARAELDVVNMAPRPKLADLAQLPEVLKPKDLHRPRVHNAARRAMVRTHEPSDGAHAVGRNTQEVAQPLHEATPVVGTHGRTASLPDGTCLPPR